MATTRFKMKKFLSLMLAFAVLMGLVSIRSAHAKDNAKVATQNIKLNFINRSQDTNNASVVIFQKNIAENVDKSAVAWTVIKHKRKMDFTYSLNFEVSAEDSYGNYTPKMTAFYGQAYEMVTDSSGNILRLASEPATSPNTVEIQNNMAEGTINGYIYRDERVLATKTNIARGQKAVFQFPPTIWIGAVSQITEGQVMNSAITQTFDRELSLDGITSADIVMTGGGSGAGATPFMFQLENINQ